MPGDMEQKAEEGVGDDEDEVWERWGRRMQKNGTAPAPQGHARLLDNASAANPSPSFPACSDAVVDQTSALRNALRRLAKPADMNADASAAFSRTSARTSSAPTSATGAPGADQGKQPAISELTAHRQAARSAARCVNGGSLPSTSTSGRPDACMTGHGAGTAGRVPFPRSRARCVGARPSRGARASRGDGVE